MGGCASSKPKVKDEDREPYGSAANTSESSRKKTKVATGGGDQPRSKPSTAIVTPPTDKKPPPDAGEKGTTAAPIATVQHGSLDKPEVIQADNGLGVKNEKKKSEQAVDLPTEASVTQRQSATTGSRSDIEGTVRTAPITQVQERRALVEPLKQQVDNGPSARSGTAQPQPASSLGEISSIKPATAAVQLQQRPVDKAPINGAAAESGSQPIDDAQVHVLISAPGAVKQPPVQQLKQPPQQQPQPTVVAPVAVSSSARSSTVGKADGDDKQAVSRDVVSRPIGSEPESARDGLTNGLHVEVAASSGPSSSTVVGSEQRHTADIRRASFATSSKRAVDVSTSQTSTSGSVKPQSPEVIGDHHVDIKPIDPKMQIFDALNASDRNKTATEAAQGTTTPTTTLATVADVKETQDGEAKSSQSVELLNGSATPEEKIMKVEPVIAEIRSTADEAIQQTSGKFDQFQVKSTTDSTTVTAAQTVTKEKDVSPAVAVASSHITGSESQTLATTKSTDTVSPSPAVSSTSTVSSLPRPLTSLNAHKSVSITSPIASPSGGHESQADSATKPQGECNGDSDKSDKAKTNTGKPIDHPTTETPTSRDESTPIAKTPSAERTSRLPTFSVSGVQSPIQQQTSVTSGSSASPKVASESVPSSNGSSATVSTPTTPKTTSSFGRERPPSTTTPVAAAAAAANVVSLSVDDLNRIKDLLIDLSAENRSISSRHHLAPNTRVKILQTVDQWLAKGAKNVSETATSNGHSNGETANRKSSRVLIITGRPGVGKTCLAAELFRRYSNRNQLTGSHFFDHRTSSSSGVDHNRAVAALMSLARSLFDADFPGYASSLPPLARISKAASVNGVVELFSLLVGQPLRSADVTSAAHRSSSSGDKVIAHRVLVIDALDECDPADHDQLCRLIDEFDASTPEWLYLVATVRSDDSLATRLLATDRVKTVELRADAADPDCVGDVKRYMRDSMSKYIDRISLDGALTQLAKNAEGNFLCAKLLKTRLDALPPDTKLALRDISLTFPVGFVEICRQTFQTLHDRLLSATDKNRNKNRPTAYVTVTSLLAIAREPLHRSAFGAENEETVVQSTSGGVLTIDDDGMISLCHDAVAEWLLSERAAAPLGVNLVNARQLMAEAVVGWLRPVLADDGDEDNGTSPATTVVHRSLTEYAAKHALRHLTDATRQQDNIAKSLCSLKFVEYKLKIPGVRLENLLADYNHSHVQTGPASGDPKLITLESYMKRNVDLVEQISLMHRFVVRRGPHIVSVGPSMTLHVAANYPTVTRIQQNARLDLGDVPWFEDLIAVADSKSVNRTLSGTIVDVDLSTDQRLIAVVTTSDPGQPLLYVFNAATMEPTTPDPVDLRATVLPDFNGSGLFARFIPAGTTPSVFVGSLTQFVPARGGRPVDSGLDLTSVKLAERYAIECCAVGGSLLACAVNTLPFGGRALHVILFDVVAKKCTRTVEVLKFRFGGSAQYGVKACALSADGGLLCACVKQSSRAELKVIVWTTAKGDAVSSIDVDDDSLSKCCIFTGEQPAVIITSGVRILADKERRDGSSLKSYAWSYQNKASKPVRLDSGTERSVGHAVGPLSAWAQWRDSGLSSELILSLFKRGAVAFVSGDSTSPDRKYIVGGLEEVAEVLPLDKSVLFLSKNAVHMLQYQSLHSVEVSPTSFAAADARIESVCFMPRSDDPLVSFSPLSMPSTGDNLDANLTAFSLSAKPEGLAVIGKYFDRQRAPNFVASDSADSIFVAPEVVTCSTDGSAVLMRCRDSVQVVEVTSGTRRALPRYSDLDVGKTSTTTDDAIRLCVVSPKDSLVGVVYAQVPQSIYLFDVKTPQTGRPLQQLRTQSDTADSTGSVITDFSFLPHNGHVIACHRKLNNDDGDSLSVWNQRSGALVSTEWGLRISFVRVSFASDRLVVALRCQTGSGNIGKTSASSLLLRNHDNRFSKSLDTQVTWSPEARSTDVEFSVDGTVLIGVGGGMHCCVWNAGNGEILRSFTGVSASEVVGMLTNAHALLHDPKGERLLLVDVTSGLNTPPVVAAASTDGCLCRKWTGRRLRVSPRGGVVVGVTERRELRVYACRNMSSVKRQTTLQIMKSQAASK